MNENKKWHVGMRNGHNASNIYQYSGKTDLDNDAIAQVYNVSMHRHIEDVKDDEGIDNAYLIAAAPELLEALEFYTAICGNTCYSVTRETAKEMYDLARNAINKASGKHA